MTKTGKEKIISATKDLFISGEKNISLQKVAMMAKVAKSLIFHFFKNKDNLLMEVSKEMVTIMLNDLYSIQKENISPLQKIQKIFRKKRSNTRR